jgi:hypothetical protein
MLEKKEGELTSISLNVPSSLAPAQTEEKKQLVPDEKILDYYEEAIKNIKEDRSAADDAYKLFLEMVINGGDGTSSSKEAVVNLLKIKSETNDRMLKILDLWTRIHLRDKDTYPKYLTVQQNNKIDSAPTRGARKMIEMMKMGNVVPIDEVKNEQ